MRLLLLTIILSITTFNSAFSQKAVGVELITSGTNTSLRGMSLPSDSVIWVSGSNGTIGKSVNSGKTWSWMIVPGYAKRDFRDIEAFDSSTAIAMAVDNPAVIIKTTDGGATWKKVLERNMPGMFLDAMDFKNRLEGICIGDPINMGLANQKQFYTIRTSDGGDTWKEIAADQMQAAKPGEAIFAASGTNISFLDDPDFEYCFVTGGAVCNLYMAKRGRSNKIVNVPIVQGKETEGVFSMAVDEQKNIYCIGGDFKKPSGNVDNYRYLKYRATKWDSAVISPPSGYRSCIRVIKNKTLVACGPTGVDYAVNGQKEWKKVSDESFNVCMVSKGKEVIFAGEKGKVGKLVY